MTSNPFEIFGFWTFRWNVVCYVFLRNIWYDISLSLDPETGLVTYTVSTTDYDDAADILETLQDSNVVDSLTTDSGVVVSNVMPRQDIVAEVNVIVNSDEVTVPLQQAENRFEALLSNEYESQTESTFSNNTFQKFISVLLFLNDYIRHKNSIMKLKAF